MTPTELYDQDFNLWVEQTIHHLQHQNFVSLDLEHLIEELQTLGKSEKKSLRSNLMILIAHLLKLTIQFDVPETMKMSWYRSVAEHRKRVLIDIKDTPSLKTFLPTALTQAYPDARDLAIRESKFASFGITPPPEDCYPLMCPFSLEQLLDEDFYG
jgi:hypothetical protein